MFKKTLLAVAVLALSSTAYANSRASHDSEVTVNQKVEISATAKVEQATVGTITEIAAEGTRKYRRASGIAEPVEVAAEGTRKYRRASGIV
jgi:hypothetical protein